MDEAFEEKTDVLGAMSRLHETITTPIVTKKYGYAIRINEARLLPPEISNISTLHDQNLRKALVSISIVGNTLYGLLCRIFEMIFG